VEVFVACLLLLPGSLRPMAAQSSPSDEYRKKAALIHKIAKFVHWPTQAFPGSSSPICIGVLGDDPFGNDLEQALEGKQLHGRPLTIRRIQAVSQAKECHVLFISRSEEEHIESILATLTDVAVLTVSESKGFINHGGIIKLVGSTQFEINSGAMSRANLRIGSDLYGVALRVVRAKESRN